MKDFVKWLGVNEKVAKVVVWIAIIMILLIIINEALDSMGFPYYKLTYENLKAIPTNKIIDFASKVLMSLLNFYSIVLLVFRVKDIKKIFKYALLYLILNIIIVNLTDYGILQIFIVIYLMWFCYHYSSKNKKYILYGILSLALNTVIQYISYLYKLKFIDQTALSSNLKLLISFDYFIIIFVIILIKELILRKRRG